MVLQQVDARARGDKGHVSTRAVARGVGFHLISERFVHPREQDKISPQGIHGYGKN